MLGREKRVARFSRGTKIVKRKTKRVYQNKMWEAAWLYRKEAEKWTVKGSIYAEIHHWCVNVHEGEASIKRFSRRTVGQKSAALKVGTIAQETADLILHQKSSPKLTWKSDSVVYLKIEEIIPATNAQTTSSRRKRFKAALETLISPHGWKRTGPYRFEK